MPRVAFFLCDKIADMMMRSNIYMYICTVMCLSDFLSVELFIILPADGGERLAHLIKGGAFHNLY